MLTTFLLGLWLTMRLAQGTPIGTALRRMLVDAPAARLLRITRGQVLLALTIASLALALIWLLENDGRLLVAMGLPEVMCFAMAFDLASLLDLAVVAILATSTGRFQALRVTLVRRFMSGRSHRRAVRVRRPRPPANDDEHHPVEVMALAA